MPLLETGRQEKHTVHFEAAGKFSYVHFPHAHFDDVGKSAILAEYFDFSQCITMGYALEVNKRFHILKSFQ